MSLEMPGPDSPAASAAEPFILDASGERSLLDPSTPLGALSQQYLNYMLVRERDNALRLVHEALDAGTSLEDIFTGVFRTSQRELGRLWQIDHISIAQEHYCTAATQTLMAQLSHRFFASPRRGTSIVAATMEGSLHELGIRMCVDLFELAGWDTLFLGARPPGPIHAAVVTHRPQVVLLSATLAKDLPAVQATLRVLKDDPLCAGTLVMVGGLAFHAAPELWLKWEADGFAFEAEEAIAWANAQVPVGGPKGGRGGG